MLGLIVCGGKSTRMGDDKGLLMLDNRIWAQHAKEKIAALNLPVMLSINSDQVEPYQLFFKKGELIVDADDINIAGPLLGILSAHLKFPNEDILVLACDMPNMQMPVLKELLACYQKGSHEAIAFINGDQLEPMCAVYSSGGLAEILSLYKNNNLDRHSMMHALEILDTDFIKAKESWQPYFRNFNSPDDLK